MTRIAFLALAVASVACAAVSVLRPTPRQNVWHLGAVLVCLAGITLILGFPVLAGALLIAASVAIAALRSLLRGTATPETAADRPVTVLVAAIVVAALIGLSVPLFLDSTVSRDDLPLPIEGRSAAAGGGGLASALFSRHLLATAGAVLLLGAAMVGRGALRRRA